MSVAYTAARRPNEISGAQGDKLFAVRVIVNPASDAFFAQRAAELAETVETPEELERLLRATYERARVVQGVTDIVQRWYVYRDGRWINTTAG